MNLPIEDESVDQSDPFIDESGNISGSTETGIKWNNIPEMSDRFSSSHEKRHVSLGTLPTINTSLLKSNVIV